MSRPAILIQLRADHRRVLRDLAAVDRALAAAPSRPRSAAPRPPATRTPFATLQRALDRLGRQFGTHMAAEDEQLFPALAAVLPEARPGLEGLASEHAELRALLAGLVARFAAPPGPRRDEALRVQWSDFSELLRIHIRKEESLVFHIAEHVVPVEDWERIEARRFPGRPGARPVSGSRTRKGSSPMKRIIPLLLLLCFAGAAASCGGRSNSESATPSAGTGASPASGATAVATVSKFDSGPRAGETPIDAAKAEQGEALFSSKGCSACHAMGKRLTGPDLAGVSMRRTSAWIENQILHPDVMVKEDPISHGLFAQFALQMPKQGLTPDEAHAVIEYFKHMDHKAGENQAESHH